MVCSKQKYIFIYAYNIKESILTMEKDHRIYYSYTT